MEAVRNAVTKKASALKPLNVYETNITAANIAETVVKRRAKKADVSKFKAAKSAAAKMADTSEIYKETTKDTCICEDDATVAM